MAINRDAFIGNYLEETKDNIRLLDDGVLKLKKDPENEEVLSSVLRALHTVKGSSRMLKFNEMEKLAHSLENVFKGMKEGRYLIDSNLIKLVFLGSDLFRAGLHKIETDKSDDIKTEKFIDLCERAYSNEVYTDELGSLQLEVRGGSDEKGKEKIVPQGEERDGNKNADKGIEDTPDGPEYQSIRVKLSNVENIIEILNGVIIKQFQFKQIQEQLSESEKSYQNLLGRMRKLQTDFKEEGTSIYKEGLEHLKEVQELRKSFGNQIVSLEQSSYKLQERIMKLSMLPLELILGGLPRMVEEAALMLGKAISFSSTGADVLMDKAILEKLNDPVLHLIRNSVDHGIETPDERKAANKSREGHIRVDCTSEGGNIIIRINDDGAGIDREKIMKQALEKGLTNEAELQELTENEVYNFIFMPGFSTKKTITDLSGRGVGLDIVKHNIDKVKGKISIRSTRGKGTEFTLAVPLSLATVSGFFVRAGGEKFLIPSNFVQKIVRLYTGDKIMYYNKEAFKLENQIIPLYSLAALLEREPENRGNYLYVMVVESVGERIGIVVDNLLQHASLIYKPVPRNLQKMNLIQGIVFDETYSIINILFIPELINRFKRQKSIDIVQGVSGGKRKQKSILVVDDSLNTREIEKSILELENYKVFTAQDGIDGLQQLKERQVDMVLTDLDMPRMDGITMIENIRKENINKTLPIVVVSAGTDSETQKKAMEAGADAYIIKSEFDRNSLIATTKELMQKS